MVTHWTASGMSLNIFFFFYEKFNLQQNNVK